MTTVAVIANRKKSMGGGLPELRRLLADEGVTDPIWCEVTKGRKVAKAVRAAKKQGADLFFVWGGDGSVQRCLDVLGGTDAEVAILPAGTGNLLANGLGIPLDLAEAVKVGLYGARTKIDLGVINGERFAVMAGAGFDAVMMKNADGELKDRFGRLAYVWTGIKATSMASQRVRIKVDGHPWFTGRATCVLVGSLGTLSGGLVAFPDALPDDGVLDVGVVTADGTRQWARVIGRLAFGNAERSPLVEMTKARTIDIRFDHRVDYELDGGEKDPVKRLRVDVEPGAATICVPTPDVSVSKKSA